jgi:serine-type D-Ala-D-Ala carboxypeptidase (penicillin-binding protein 5/6)
MPDMRTTRGSHARRASGWRAGARGVAIAAAVIVVVAFAVLVRAATESTPPLRATPVLVNTVSLPGTPPAWAWPARGEAAAEVSGVGSIGTHGPDRPVPIASLAKMMTAYVVLRDHPLEPGQSGFTLTVNAAEVADYQADQAQAQSVLAVAAGEVLTELQLLEGLLVASGNNVAPILADYDSGSPSAFVAKMNSTARDLGMTNTTYTDPSGLSPTTVSTAADQLILVGHAMGDAAFARIVDMRSVTLPVAGTVTNFNTAVGTDGYIGVKTGSDSQAGGCLAFANRQTVDGRPVTVLGVVLGQDVGQVLTSTLIPAAIGSASSLVRSVISAMSIRTVLRAGTTVDIIANAQGRRVTATTASGLVQLGWAGMDVLLRFSPAPVGTGLRTGQRLGTVSVGSEQPVSSTVSATATMPPLSWSWRLHHIF